MIHFFEGVSKFFLHLNKIGHIATTRNPDVPPSSYKSSQSLYERICIHTACTFSIYCPAR